MCEQAGYRALIIFTQIDGANPRAWGADRALRADAPRASGIWTPQPGGG